jgi:hypothetical protein
VALAGWVPPHGPFQAVFLLIYELVSEQGALGRDLRCRLSVRDA